MSLENITTTNLNQQFAELTNIRDSIELMSKFNQVEILRILTNNKGVTINENKYGIHINMTDLSASSIEELIRKPLDSRLRLFCKLTLDLLRL